MIELFRDVYRTLVVPRYAYTDLGAQVRARIALNLLAFGLLVEVFGLLSSLLLPVSNEVVAGFRFGEATALAVTLLLAIAIHVGLLRIATWFILFFLLIASYFSADSGILLLILLAALTTLYAGLVIRIPGIIITLLVEGSLLVSTMSNQAKGLIHPLDFTSPEQIPIALSIIGVTILGLALIAITAAQEIQRALNSINRSTLRLRAISDITQRLSSTSGLTELLQRTVEYVRDRFGYYYVQMFLIDADRHFATLVASTGEAGEILMARGYSVAVSASSVIGRVTLSGEPFSISAEERNKNDVELVTPANEVLKDTRSELALPLVIGDRVIGVLDIHSNISKAFAGEDLESLKLLSIQIALAVNNAKLSEEQKSALFETRRMYLEAETNLRETQRLNRYLTGKSWQEYLNSSNANNTGIGFTLSENKLLPDNNWSALLQEAATKRNPVIETAGDKQIVAVPVELRGHVIGAVEVELHGSQNQADTLDMLQAVANRLALSIENARLFEQAQDLAQQEFEVNSISAQLQGATDLEEVLKTVIRELGRALGAESASIRLGKPERRGTAPLGTAPLINTLPGQERRANLAAGASFPNLDRPTAPTAQESGVAKP